MLAKTTGFTVIGIDGREVHIEVDLAQGLPAYTTVGLPDASVRESRERVVSAVRNSGFDFPAKRITVNLAPAEMKKAGAQLDLPIALGILAASGQMAAGDRLPRTGLIGELALDGKIRPVWGILPMALRAAEAGLKEIIVPEENAREASCVPIRVLPASHLKEVVRHLSGETALTAAAPLKTESACSGNPCDLSEVGGQAFAKRALEVAASGGHNLLLIGPPGIGKSMLAKRLPGILPPLSFEEALEVTRIHSVMGLLSAKEGIVTDRPFRAPHHTSSDIALVGGGNPPRPGEISLAHHGVLFLDELPEFGRDALEALRQPLESGRITVSRASGSVCFPSRFMLIGAMNPCPCGYLGHPSRPCQCTPLQVRKYRSKVSGPLLDRIDMHVEMATITFSDFAIPIRPASGGSGEEAAGRNVENSAAVRSRVLAARRRQEERFAGTKTLCNARMGPRQVRTHCRLDAAGQSVLEMAMEKLGLSARSLDRILRVSRTLADMEGMGPVSREHVVEAIQFRTLDRNSTML